MDGNAKSEGRGLLLIGLVGIVFEVLLLGALYKNVLIFDCHSTGMEGLCLAVSELPIRALCVAAVLGLLTTSHAFQRIAAGVQLRRSMQPEWTLLHIIGIVLMALPLFFLSNSITTNGFLLVLLTWMTGAVAATLGALFCFVSPQALARAAGRLSPLHWIALLAAFLAPDWARLIQEGAWEWGPLTDATFGSVAWLLGAYGETVFTNAETREMGIGEFIVLVGYQCSGIEGFGLVTLFVFVYLALFRGQIRFGRALLAWPVGLAISWMFNILRIAVLIWIGAHVSPDFAINGFHSHAGWLFFTILALGIAVTVQAVPWFRKPLSSNTVPMRPGFLKDRATLQILPFIVLMAAVLLRSTFSEHPERFYPLQCLALVGVLALFLRPLLAMNWRIDRLAIISGLGIAVVWLMVADRGTGIEQPSAIWIATRLLGTILLIPIVEELFFRGYVLDQFRNKSRVLLFVGVGVSSILFALLHVNWIGAIAAGLVFGYLVIRSSGRLEDAIVSHMAANSAVAIVAFYTSDWGLI